MSIPLRAGLAFAVALALSLAACGGRGGGWPRPTGAKPAVVLLRESKEGSAFVATATSPLPPFALRVLPTGKAKQGDRLAPILADLVADAGVRSVVVMPAREGTVAAIAKAAAGRKDLVWIIAESGDESLAAEAAADLVVDFDPAVVADGDAAPEYEPALARGLCEFARRANTGRAKLDDRNELLAALRAVGGWDWKVEYRPDPVTRIRARNHLLVSATPHR